MMNQLAFPGLGTIMARRRVGFFQATIMVAGFLLVMGYMLWYFSVIVRYMQQSEWSEAEFRAQYRPYLWALYWGLGLCVVAWFWALASSISIWRESLQKERTQKKVGESPVGGPPPLNGPR